MTSEDFRDITLGLDGVVEASHMGHPDFRAAGRIFASLTADELWAMVKITPDEQQALMASAPDVFVPASGAWGRQGCTMIRLAGANRATVRGAVILACQAIVEKAATSKAKRRPAKKRPASGRR